MRMMCTYEHGIRDRVKVLTDDDTKWFNDELARNMKSGWRLIQPVETIEQVGSNWSKIIHIAVLAAPWEDDGL